MSRYKHYCVLLLLGVLTFTCLNDYKNSIPSFQKQITVESWTSYGYQGMKKLAEESRERIKIEEEELRLKKAEEELRLKNIAEEKARQEKIRKEKQETLRASRGMSEDDYKPQRVKFIVTYYSDAEGLIGGGPKDRRGNPLRNGHVALPKNVAYGSKVIFDNYPDNIYTNVDTGGRIVWINSNTCHIDVFKKGYSSAELNKLGKHIEWGYIYHKK